MSVFGDVLYHLFVPNKSNNPLNTSYLRPQENLVEQPATSTNTLRSTVIGWPFLLPISLYYLGLMRVFADFPISLKIDISGYFLSDGPIFSVSLRFLKQRSQRTSDFQSRANIG
ncbi:MAG: Uncharacterised protein [Marinobacterium sp. xm-d-530]|nr:MAG: Uncharacterised protein [Marinobacterium sp. xm-d-530]